MAYQAWYERYPEDFEHERRELEARGFVLNRSRLEKEGIVEFHGPSRVDPSRRLRIQYPDSFPSLHPSVFTDGGSLMPSHHRSDSGEICIFGFAAQTRWHARMTGADAVAEADEIVALNLQPTDVPGTPTGGAGSAAPEPLSDVFPYDTDMVLIVPANLVDQPLGGRGTVSFRVRESHPLVPRFRQAMVEEVRINNQPAEKAQAEFRPWIQGTRYNATLHVVDIAPRTVVEAQLFLQRAGIRLGPRGQQRRQHVLVFPEASTTGPKTAWLLLEEGGPAPRFFRCYPYRPEIGTARTPGLEALQQKSVAIVGLGTVGSRIATHLAQAGVGRLHLIDMDRVSPGNLVRFDGDLLRIGMAKVDAVRCRLLEVNPFTQVTGQLDQVGALWTKEQAATFFERLSNVDLVVETTALHVVRRYLNERMYSAGIPLVYAWVTNGIWGGEVVRVLPGETPCYLCFRDSDLPAAPSDPSPLIFPSGCVQPTFTGAGFDSGELAAQAARVVVQTLLRGTGAYPDMAGLHLVWRNRGEDGAFAPSIRVDTYERTAGCYVCGVP